VLGATGRGARGFIPAGQTGTPRGTELRKAFKLNAVIDAKVIESRTLAKNLRLEGATPHRFTFWTSYGFSGGLLKGLRFGNNPSLVMPP
jgi:hypothetical protein